MPIQISLLVPPKLAKASDTQRFSSGSFIVTRCPPKATAVTSAFVQEARSNSRYRCPVAGLTSGPASTVGSGSVQVETVTVKELVEDNGGVPASVTTVITRLVLGAWAKPG